MNARLLRARPAEDPGYRRLRAGRGFRYVDAAGRAVPAGARTRIEALVIPPGWSDVWIAAEPRAHIQAVGTDADGRRQYLYHAAWRMRRDRRKFERALALARALPGARARVTAALRHDGIDRSVVLAAAFRLLDAGAPRIGSARYLLRHGSRGLTTLRRGDAVVDGARVVLTFPAKSGRRARVEVEDADLAAVVEALSVGRSGDVLLAYRRGRRRVALTPGEVNSALRELTGGPFTAKDFRTLRGTVVAARRLALSGVATSPRERRHAEIEAVLAAAEALGNTPSVARSSYIDPRVLRRYAEGAVLDLGGSAEAALVRLLEE